LANATPREYGEAAAFAPDGVLGVASGRALAHCAGLEGERMGTPADYTIIVLLVAMAVGLWSMFDKIVQMQRDIDALKRRAGVGDEPPAAPPNLQAE